MNRHIEIEIQGVKDKLLMMGGIAEKAIEEATEALIHRQPERLNQVHELEYKINQLHMEVDEACVQLLARNSPLAGDLRVIVAIIKMNSDLERMGDQAVNIAHNAKRYLTGPEIIKLRDVEIMATCVRKMVRNALDAFVNKDIEMAEKILKSDDEVDRFKATLFDELLGLMGPDRDRVERVMNLILITRNLERTGDHATNIAEDVIFASTGEDIRHGARSV